MDLCSTAQANAFSLIYGPSNFDQSSPSVLISSRLRNKAHGSDGQPNSQNPGCFKPAAGERCPPMRKAVVRDWVASEPKIHEWANALSKIAKATGRNYGRLLYLYRTRNPRFRTFKSTAQWGWSTQFM
jgi:hypothetical protein